jgi:4-hydroxy-4-methyl-2-oxoglutarate aldolase
MKFTGICFKLMLLAYSGISIAQPSLSDAEILKLFKGLRVADISDAMDQVGLHDACLMSPEIEPLWRDIEHFSHQITGIALTVRYVPTNMKFPTGLSKEEFEKWRDNWYTVISPETFIDSITPGKVIVIDDAGKDDTGTAGSNNTMLWKKKGAVGVVSTGGVRDTDEVIKEGIPVYMDLSKRGRGIRPGRNELESVNKPVVIGGVLVRAGDIIIADGDGVIVVPRDKAIQVAKVALNILNTDKEQRKTLYRELGIPIDFTVE